MSILLVASLLIGCGSKSEETASEEPASSEEAEGTIVAMKDIPDPVFAEGMVGPCIGIEPKNGKIVAPCDGTIMQLSFW